jgi:hypothetical protein
MTPDVEGKVGTVGVVLVSSPNAEEIKFTKPYMATRIKIIMIPHSMNDLASFSLAASPAAVIYLIIPQLNTTTAIPNMTISRTLRTPTKLLNKARRFSKSCAAAANGSNDNPAATVIG